MEWKKIPVNDGRYVINENGEIFNTATDKYLHPCVFNNGYKTVSLVDVKGNKIKRTVHRLVAEAFIPNPNNYPVVMHLDNNKENCNVNNLQWGTYRDNNIQAIRDGLIKVPRPDNRKIYTLSNKNAPYTLDKLGIKNVIKTIGFGTDSAIRNYIFRKQPIPRGEYAGWYLTLKDERSQIIS